MPAELIELAPFAKAHIRDGEQVILCKERDCDDGVLAPQLHTPHTLCIPAHGPASLLVEPEALAEPGGHTD